MDAERLVTNSAARTAKPCGPDAPTLVSSLREMILQATVAKEPGRRGEHGVSVKTVAQGMSVDAAYLW